MFFIFIFCHNICHIRHNNIFSLSLLIQIARLNNNEKYLAEAYGCQPCTVRCNFLTEKNILEIKGALIKKPKLLSKKTGTKTFNPFIRTKKNDLPFGPSQRLPTPLSPKSQREHDAKVFKPPVPFPVVTIEVHTMDATRKWYPIYLFNLISYF